MSKGFAGRSAGNTEKVGKVEMELTESCGDSQFIILILQTFSLTSKSTLKGHVLLASILVTT